MQAWELVRRIKPDLLITEIGVDGIYGIDLCKRVRESSPATAILISTHSYSATKFFYQAMRAVASGIYLKRSGPSELMKAVVETLNGRPYCDESVARLVYQRPAQIDSLQQRLTAKEIGVLIRQIYGIRKLLKSWELR
jgi:DNA-binding NarL/FixJ family response regulator